MLPRTEVCSVGRRDCHVVFLGGLRDSWPQTPPMTLTEYFLRALSLLLGKIRLIWLCLFDHSKTDDQAEGSDQAIQFATWTVNSPKSEVIGEFVVGRCARKPQETPSSTSWLRDCVH